MEKKEEEKEEHIKYDFISGVVRAWNNDKYIYNNLKTVGNEYKLEEKDIAGEIKSWKPYVLFYVRNDVWFLCLHVLICLFICLFVCFFLVQVVCSRRGK
jgi:hypothetical protein